MLQPGSSLDCPIDTFVLHPVRCLGGSSVLVPYSLHLLGFLDENCFTGWGSQPHTLWQTGGSGLHIYIPRDRIYQLYPHILGIHFSCLLQHAWITLGLFLFLATTWELNYEVPQSISRSMYSKGLHIQNPKIQKCTSNPTPIPNPKLLTPM